MTQNKNLKAITVLTQDGRKVSVEYNGTSRFIIHEPPLMQQHATEDDITRHQITNMMLFQEKLSMLLRAKLKSRKMQIPLQKGKYHVKIDLSTPRLINDLPPKTIRKNVESSPLLNTMKSVIDAINREIVRNDSQIYSSEITYIQTNPRTRAAFKTRLDHLKVSIIDLASNPATLVVEIETDIFVVPKEPPLVYNAEEKAFVVNEFHHEELAAALIPVMKVPKQKKYHIEIHFAGKVASLDIDNMAKVYVPILRELGVPDESVHGISLFKQDAQRANSFIDVRIRDI